MSLSADATTAVPLRVCPSCYGLPYAHLRLLVLRLDGLSGSSARFVPRSLTSPSSSPPSSPSSKLPVALATRPVVELRRLLGLAGKDDDPAGPRDEADVDNLDADADAADVDEGLAGGRAGNAAEAGGVEARDLDFDPGAVVFDDEPPAEG